MASQSSQDQARVLLNACLELSAKAMEHANTVAYVGAAPSEPTVDGFFRSQAQSWDLWWIEYRSAFSQQFVQWILSVVSRMNYSEAQAVEFWRSIMEPTVKTVIDSTLKIRLEGTAEAFTQVADSEDLEPDETASLREVTEKLTAFLAESGEQHAQQCFDQMGKLVLSAFET